MPNASPDKDATRPARRPIWGPWATLGLGAAVVAGFILTQVLVTAAFLIGADASGAGLGSADQAHAYLQERGGLLLSVSTVCTTAVGVALMWFFVRARRGEPFRQYLALIWVSRATLGRWLAGAVLLILAIDVLTVLADRPVVPEFMRATYLTAHWPPLYWLAVILAAPLFEELFFRGFLFRGLAAGRLGVSGAVLVTAILWAVIHAQYDAFERGLVFAGGVFLGYARARSGSVLLTFALHALWNLVAVIEVIVQVADASP